MPLRHVGDAATIGEPLPVANGNLAEIAGRPRIAPIQWTLNQESTTVERPLCDLCNGGHPAPIGRNLWRATNRPVVIGPYFDRADIGKGDFGNAPPHKVVRCCRVDFGECIQCLPIGAPAGSAVIALIGGHPLERARSLGHIDHVQMPASPFNVVSAGTKREFVNDPGIDAERICVFFVGLLLFRFKRTRWRCS